MVREKQRDSSQVQALHGAGNGLLQSAGGGRGMQAKPSVEG